MLVDQDQVASLNQRFFAGELSEQAYRLERALIIDRRFGIAPEDNEEDEDTQRQPGRRAAETGGQPSPAPQTARGTGWFATGLLLGGMAMAGVWFYLQPDESQPVQPSVSPRSRSILVQKM